jgi:hypothetical protein
MNAINRTATLYMNEALKMLKKQKKTTVSVQTTPINEALRQDVQKSKKEDVMSIQTTPKGLELVDVSIGIKHSGSWEFSPLNL